MQEAMLNIRKTLYTYTFLYLYILRAKHADEPDACDFYCSRILLPVVCMIFTNVHKPLENQKKKKQIYSLQHFMYVWATIEGKDSEGKYIRMMWKEAA